MRRKITMDRIGTTINNYKILDIAPYEKRWVKYKVECINCGNTGEICYSTIKKNTDGCTKCFQQKGKHSPYWKGCGDISMELWTNILSSAKIRELNFEIDMKYAWNLFLKQNQKCALTGQNLVFAECSDKYKTRTASLDRIDSTKGYIKGNVQWIHKDINYFKGGLSDEELFSLCKAIYEYKQLNNFQIVDTTRKYYRGSSTRF